LSGEDRFADGYRRYSNQEELDKLIGEWTINLSAYEVMNVLQKAGVAAAPSMSSKDLTEDPHLNERGFIVEWDHPVIGRQKHAGILWKTSKTLGMIYRHGPMVGEHNEYVFCELLGMPREELARLSEQGVVY
jgi:crotonobetainyl-CoA:carnitine CoA-transferase CaiB-like acyl-CoA transferase